LVIYLLHNKTVDDLLQIKKIYLEPQVKNYKRVQEILAKISECNSGIFHIGRYQSCIVTQESIEERTKVKRKIVVLGTKKSLS